MFYILKLITIKEIREILAEHKTKQEGMFTKHEKLVSDLISGHQTLLKQRLDELCDSGGQHMALSDFLSFVSLCAYDILYGHILYILHKKFYML